MAISAPAKSGSTYGRAVPPEQHRECCHHTCRAGKPEKCPQRSRYWPKTAFEFWQILLNFLLVSVSAGMMAFACNDVRLTGKQLKETQRQGEQTERALVITQRARVVVSGVSKEGEFTGGVEPTIKATMINEGVTPALNVRVHADIILARADAPQPETRPLALCHPGGSSAVISPRSPHDALPDTRPLLGTEAEVLNGAADGDGIYWKGYVFGSVTYDDDFAAGRESTFCMWWQVDKKRFVDCEAGNSAP